MITLDMHPCNYSAAVQPYNHFVTFLFELIVLIQHCEKDSRANIHKYTILLMS